VSSCQATTATRFWPRKARRASARRASSTSHLRRDHLHGQRPDSPRDKEDPRRRLWRLRWRVKTQRETRALTAVNTAAKVRRTCSELGKEREGRRKTRAQTRHNTTKDHHKSTPIAPYYYRAFAERESRAYRT
jgi:hypothetical protein